MDKVPSLMPVIKCVLFGWLEMSRYHHRSHCPKTYRDSDGHDGGLIFNRVRDFVVGRVVDLDELIGASGEQTSARAVEGEGHDSLLVRRQCVQYVEATQHVPHFDDVVSSGHEHSAWGVEQEIFDLVAVI